MTSGALSISLSNSLRLIFLSCYLLPTLLCAQIDEGEAADSAGVDGRKQVEVETRLGRVEGEKVKKSSMEDYTPLRSPRKAALLSLAVPGLGQIYNKKYWKVPILYAGFAVTGWYLRDNIQNIQFYKDAFIAATDGNPETVNPTDFTPQQLERLMDQYYEWRDLSYIILGLIYILNIVDASVDAHLFYFDVSEDISMRIRPTWSPLMPAFPALSLTLKL